MDLRSVQRQLKKRYFDIVAPEATDAQLEDLREKTEQYCVVFQTLADQPKLETEWA